MIFCDKKELRKDAAEKIAALSDNDKARESNVVFSTISQMQCFKNSNNILLYYSLPSELQTHLSLDVWRKLGKNIYLPRVEGNDLAVVPFINIKELKSGAFGVMEPTGLSVDANIIDLVIVPAVALDRNGNRCGHGKGFYDRLLSRIDTYKIGVGFDCQFYEDIPVSNNDVKLDAIITLSHILIKKRFILKK